MGSPLGPTLADIIMTELENIVIQPLLASGTLKFYARYVDDTLVLAKPYLIFIILTLKYNLLMKYLLIIMSQTYIFLTLKSRLLALLSTAKPSTPGNTQVRPSI